MSSPLIETTLPNKKVVLHYDRDLVDDQSSTSSLYPPPSRTPSLTSSRSRTSSTSSRSSDGSEDTLQKTSSSNSERVKSETTPQQPQLKSKSRRPVRKPLRVSSEVEQPRSFKERLQADLDSSSMQAFSSTRRR